MHDPSDACTALSALHLQVALTVQLSELLTLAQCISSHIRPLTVLDTLSFLLQSSLSLILMSRALS